MIEFRINLIRGQVPSAPARRQRYRLMIAYLAVAGMLLAVAMGVAASRLVETQALGRQRDELEARFLAGHEGADSIRSHARNLERRTAREVAALRLVERQLVGDARPARLLRALVLTLPSGISLRNFTLSAEEQVVTFELLVFGGSAEKEAGASDLLALWARDTVINSQIKELNFLGSQMEGNVARNDMVWRFSARLQGKGT